MDSQDAAPDADSDPSKVKQPESIAEKEVAYKKRHDEQAAKQKKAEEDATAAATKADSCKRMNDYKASLSSGRRISQTDANGNQTMLTDDQRASELNTMNQNLSTCN